MYTTVISSRNEILELKDVENGHLINQQVNKFQYFLIITYQILL